MATHTYDTVYKLGFNTGLADTPYDTKWDHHEQLSHAYENGYEDGTKKRLEDSVE